MSVRPTVRPLVFSPTPNLRGLSIWFKYGERERKRKREKERDDNNNNDNNNKKMIFDLAVATRRHDGNLMGHGVAEIGITEIIRRCGNLLAPQRPAVLADQCHGD